MKIRTSFAAMITIISMSAIAFFINPFSARTLAKDSGTPHRSSAVAKPAWLDGSGKDLRIKISGEVFDENGEPQSGCKLQVRSESRSCNQDLPVVMEENRFWFWVPVGKSGWLTLYLDASSADGRGIARKTVFAYQIREAAVEGIKLRMKQPERTVEVRVVADGKPVPDASVAAEFTGMRCTGKTNGAGIATFPAMNRDKLSQLTAWTKDFMIGGYSFGRKPPRDPMVDKHIIELEKCRSQTIRIINDEDKSPIADIDFVFTVGSGAPDYQYPGKTPDCEMKTDANGEAVYRRFPNWKKHNYYVNIHDKHWVKAADEEMVDGVIVVKLKKSQFGDRRPIVGQVKSTDGNVAGFYVSIRSFQGEEKNCSDVLHAFTDKHGRFTADYLPGATYCICVNDARFVSNIIDRIPYEPTTDKTNAPSLNIFAGQPVEVVVTSGPAKRPLAHQFINLRTSHDYSWREGGRTRHGSGGRRWWVITDEHGKAQTFALSGKEIKGSIFSPQWRSIESAQVKTSGVTKLEFHQRIAAKRKIMGRLLLAENMKADLSGAVVEIGSVDGETNERLTLSANPEGGFDFESKASRIGIYAHTKDSKAAGVCIVDRLEEPIILQLKPTAEFHGQLLGVENRPLRDHAVRASLYVSGKRDYSLPFLTSFSAATFEAKTDSDGNYTLTGLPCEVELSLRADSIDGSDRTRYLDKLYLTPNESRPRAVSRLWKPKKNLTFAQRYEKTLRDCRLSNFHVMVILFRPSDGAKQFVDVNLMDYAKTKEVMSFMQLQGQVGEGAASAEIAEFGKLKSWPTPEKEKVFACAIDANGKELGRIEFDPKDPQSPKLAAQFVRKYTPKQADAKKKWDEAFATAKQSNRKVWIRISQRYCGPCFMLARWLDDQKEILKQDYVFLKIDDVRDLHGFEVAKRLTGDEHYGVPFHAIFDVDGKMLIDSKSATGNIGHPSGFAGKKHLRKMLTETRGKLTDKQIDEIVASLSD